VRLTHAQWENSVRDVLRLTDATGFFEALAADVAAYPYSTNEEVLEVGPALVVDYAEAAEGIAARIAADPALLAEVHPGTDALEFITEVGRRFYRRPLTETELLSFQQIFDVGAGLASATDPWSGGVGLVLEVLLQSPRFLYRIEAVAAGERLDGYELATKLSYFITNSTPSDALLDRAAAGELDSGEGLRAIARELVATASARDVLRGFHAETFDFARFATITKDEALGYAASTSAELETASGMFFDHLFDESLGVRDILLSDVAYMSEAMAALYGVAGPGAGQFVGVTLAGERPGFFAQLPFLILHSVNETPNPIARGAAINYDVLCAEVPADPGELTFPLPVADATNRERVTQATSGPTCESCHHVYLNPLGFALENFDGLGRLRSEDEGRAVDTSGAYPFVEGRLDFAGARELMSLLAESQQAHRCYAAHLSEYGLAHVLGPEEESVVDALATASLDGSASLADLVVELVMDPAFHTRRGAP
jgi:hypothetical protein